ncbi:MAG: hypothetical protein ABIH49_00100 [archaeon]
MNKKGLSTIVITVIMIALVLAVVSIVWGVVNNLISEQISTSSCFGNFDKVTLNKRYTCYDSTPGVGELRFSLNIGDINIDSILVSITNELETKSFTLNSISQTIENLRDSDGSSVTMPEKNSGRTYFYSISDQNGKPSIQIAPKIDNKQCDVSDFVAEVDDCNIVS